MKVKHEQIDLVLLDVCYKNYRPTLHLTIYLDLNYLFSTYLWDTFRPGIIWCIITKIIDF
jgi:hypothetical protein